MYLGHVTEVFSPAFSAGTLFYKVNVTSLTYNVDASARSDAATGFKEMERWHTPSSLCTRQLPRTKKLRVLVSAHSETITTYILPRLLSSLSWSCIMVQSRQVGNVISFASQQHSILRRNEKHASFSHGYTSLRSCQTGGPPKVVKLVRKSIIARSGASFTSDSHRCYSEVHSPAQMFVILKMRVFSSGSTSVCQ